MIGRISHPLSQARCLTTPATAPGTTVVKYLDALRPVVHDSGRRTLSSDEVTYRVLVRWLAESFSNESLLTMDEMLLEHLERDMSSGVFVTRDGKTYRTLAQQVVPGVRRLHNAAFAAAPRSILTRPLIDGRCLSRYRFFLSLTLTTQDAMAWFEESGVRPGKAGAANTTLTIASRTLGVNEAFWLLRRLNVDGLEQVSAESLRALIPTTGPHDAAYRRVVRAINGASALYRSCVASARLPSDPTAGIAHNKFTSYQERDFLPPDEMAKIRDLSTLDSKDALAVVDRLVLLVFADAALRLGELTSLTVSNVIGQDAGYALRLFSQNQKMQDKKTVDLHLLYPETNKLMRFYLRELRPRLARADAAGLIVDRNGRSASAEALANACTRGGTLLALHTYYGKSTPSAHALRRTFGMCNAAPLGLNLQPHEIAERLRDSIEVVFRHYVTSNPLITEQRARVYRERAAGVVGRERVDQALATLRDLRLPSGMIRQVEAEAKRRQAATVEAAGDTDADVATATWLSEDEVLVRLEREWGTAPFWKKLRAYMRSHAALKRSGPHGQVYLREDVCARLTRDYIALDRVREIRGLKRQQLATALSDERVIRMGRLILLPKESIAGLLLPPVPARRERTPTKRVTAGESGASASRLTNGPNRTNETVQTGDAKGVSSWTRAGNVCRNNQSEKDLRGSGSLSPAA